MAAKPRCVVSLWGATVRVLASRATMRSIRTARYRLIVPNLASDYAYDFGPDLTTGLCMRGVVIVGKDGSVSCWRGEAPRA